MSMRETLIHPQHGRLPARKVLQCVFALSPTRRIVHYHSEELRATSRAGEIEYAMTGGAPAPGRERCRIIPPFVREFDPPEFPAGVER